MIDWILGKIGILLRGLSILINWLKSCLIRRLVGDNDCVKLDIIDDNYKDNSLYFDLDIINNSTDRIKFKKLYAKIKKQIIPIEIRCSFPSNKLNENLSFKWLKFEETGNKDRVLYSVNSTGSRKIDNNTHLAQIGLKIWDIKNIACIKSCRAKDINNKQRIEIVLEYTITSNKRARTAEANCFLYLD